MSKILSDLLYTEDHEWVKIDGDIATVGITDHAQSELGEVVYVELPDVGDSFDVGDELGTVESVKAVSEIFAPLSGEIVEINEALEDGPELVNNEPFGEGWMVKIKMSNPEQTENMMDSNSYRDLIGA
ncbi:MAG: glycine cleavage system protein GcvH [Chitinophagales bacterium]